MRNILAAAVFLISAIPSASESHSQLFLIPQLRALANADGNMAEIRSIWRFEAVSSAAIVREFDRNSNGLLEDRERGEIANAVRNGASPFTIETHLLHNGHKVSLTRPGAIRVDFVGRELIINFSVKPQSETRVAGRVALWIDDAKHNSVMDFKNDADLKASGAAFEACERRVVRASTNSASLRNQAIATEMFFKNPSDQRRPALIATRLEIDCLK